MTNKLKSKKTPKTVYFEDEDLNYLTECGAVACRTLSQEIQYNTRIVRALRERNNEEAIRLAVEGSQRQG